MTFSEWLLRRLGVLEDDDKFVEVVSWWPVWDGFMHAPLWPVLRYDAKGRRRVTGMPVWDWVRIRILFGFPPKG